MNKLLKYRFIFIALGLAAAFTSCDDWTEARSIDLVEADIEKDNPALYEQYLANLREYRGTNHKVFYAWFDNASGNPVSRGQHITAIPDSVDIVCLTNPADLPSWTVSEMESVRKNKGMKFVFNISHADLEKEYEQYLSQHPGGEGEETPMDPVEYTSKYVDRYLPLADKYGFDGLSILFYGMKTLHLTEAQKAEYLAKEAAFMSKIRTWIDQNTDKLFIFEGNPQNVTDTSILVDAEFIVVRTESLKYAAGLSYEVLMTVQDGVPTDKFMVTVSSKSLDPTDDKTGYYFNSENKLVQAIPVAAEWVSTPETGFSKYGLAVLHLQNDYYNSGNSYRNIREAIANMNPSPKL